MPIGSVSFGGSSGQQGFAAPWMEQSGRQLVNQLTQQLSQTPQSFQQHLGTLPPPVPVTDITPEQMQFGTIPPREIYQQTLAQHQAAAANQGRDFRAQNPNVAPAGIAEALAGIQQRGLIGGDIAGREAQLGYEQAGSQHLLEALGLQTDREALRVQQELDRLSTAAQLRAIGEQFRSSLAGPLLSFLRPQVTSGSRSRGSFRDLIGRPTFQPTMARIPG